MIFTYILLGLILLSILGYFIFHLIKKDLKESVLNIPAKCGFYYQKYRNRWFYWPLVILIIFTISFIFYGLFSLPLGSPNVPLYVLKIDGSVDTTAIKANASTAREFISNMNLVPVSLFGWQFLLGIIIVFFILLKKKKLTFFRIILFIILVGSLTRLIYANTTDAIFTRQYDVWSSSGYGHHGITLHIYHNFTPLPLKEGGLDNCYQLYHPKLSHYVHALIMHINSIFYGNSDPSYTLYQSIRIFSGGISIISLIIVYYIFKEITCNKNIIIIGTMFFAFSPQFFRFAALTNNDPLLYFFMLLSILFIIKFYKKQSLINAIILAISIGLAMSSKLSGALIAIVIGIVMIYIFIKMMINKEIKKGLITYIVFAFIVFPIGLFWPIFNYIMYEQDFTYVWHNLNPILLLEKYTYIDKFLSLPIGQYFNNLFMVLSNKASLPQDYNLYFSMIKSAIFGEFSYASLSGLFAVILYVINIILVALLVIFAIYKLIDSLIKKNFIPIILGGVPLLTYLTFTLINAQEIGMLVIGFITLLLDISLIVLGILNRKEIMKNKATIFMALIFLVFMISYLSLQLEYTYSCSQDFRYISLFVLVGGYFISLIYNSLKIKESKIIYSVILAIYLFSSVGMYISLGI